MRKITTTLILITGAITVFAQSPQVFKYQAIARNSSGSPSIWEGLDYTIGVHTNGGCSMPEFYGNHGTSFQVDALEQALQNFHGPNTTYVDEIVVFPYQTGNIFFPYNFVIDGITYATPGGIVCIVEGSYDETLTIDKPLTIMAPVGVVTIGQ